MLELRDKHSDVKLRILEAALEWINLSKEEKMSYKKKE
jgi:hypothetical protein